jgi:hypothetical protein
VKGENTVSIAGALEQGIGWEAWCQSSIRHSRGDEAAWNNMADNLHLGQNEGICARLLKAKAGWVGFGAGRGGGERFRFRRMRVGRKIIHHTCTPPLLVSIAFPRHTTRSIRLHHPVQLRTLANVGIQDLNYLIFSLFLPPWSETPQRRLDSW